MNRVVIDRLDLSLAGLDPQLAQAVQEALPDVLQRTLSRRLATAAAGPVSLQLSSADLGTLTLPARAGALAAAEAIAARLGDWVEVRLAAPTEAEA
jgi:hypothetical protein